MAANHEFIRVKNRKAKKKHECSTCFDVIYPGTIYEVSQGVDHTGFFYSKTCLRCVNVWNTVDAVDYDSQYIGVEAEHDLIDISYEVSQLDPKDKHNEDWIPAIVQTRQLLDRRKKNRL